MQGMIKVLLGEVKNGRLVRLPYLGYSLLLVLLVTVFVAAVVMAIGAGEHLIGGDLEQAQNKLRAWFTLPFFIVFVLFFGLIIFAGLNVTAKRIRDIGFSGWLGVLVIVLVTGVVSVVISEEASSGLHTLIWIALLLIPTNAFAKGK